MRRVLATALVALVALPASALAQCPKTTLADVEDEVFCPQCGVPLALATDAPQAKAQRAFITRMIEEECASKQEVKDALVAQFGDQVLAEPGDEGFDLAAWIVPALVLLGAGAGIAVGLARWRRSPPAQETMPAEPAGPDAARLAADMERYDR